jgi:hypothetical protein
VVCGVCGWYEWVCACSLFGRKRVWVMGLPVTQLVISDRLKIQVSMNGLLWADLEGANDFASYSDACQWLAAHDGIKLEHDGVQFRIMPKEFPCEFVATLENASEDDCS